MKKSVGVRFEGPRSEYHLHVGDIVEIHSGPYPFPLGTIESFATALSVIHVSQRVVIVRLRSGRSISLRPIDIAIIS